MTPAELLSKAEIALSSAKLLLDASDADGACNRLYYAMFDAARAALLATGAPNDAQAARTHSGVIAAFGLHIVKRGPAAVDLGRSLNRVHA